LDVYSVCAAGEQKFGNDSCHHLLVGLCIFMSSDRIVFTNCLSHYSNSVSKVLVVYCMWGPTKETSVRAMSKLGDTAYACSVMGRVSAQSMNKRQKLQRLAKNIVESLMPSPQYTILSQFASTNNSCKTRSAAQMSPPKLDGKENGE
jgi:hypothetical protein